MIKILIVDDENLVRVALHSIVDWEAEGFDFVGTAADGLEALAMVERHEPDIVITDLKMPNMDGIQLIKSLKARQYDGKILVLSNYGEFELVKQALMLGAVDYILKVTLIAADFVALLKNIGGALCSEKELKNQILQEQIQLQQSKSILKNNFFKELFSDGSAGGPAFAGGPAPAFDYQRVTAEAREAGVKPAMAKSFMYYIGVDDYEKILSGSKSDDRKKLALAMRNIISEYLHPISGVQIIEIDHQRLVVIVPSLEFQLMEGTPEQTAVKIAGLMKLYVNITVSIVVSMEFEGFFGAKTRYGQCVKAWQFRFYDGPEAIIPLDKGETGKIPDQSNYAAPLSKIRSSWEAGNIKEAMQLIENIVDHAKMERCDPAAMKMDILRLIEGVAIEVCALDFNKAPSFESMKERIGNSETRAEFLQLLSQLLHDMHSVRNQGGGRGYRKEVNDIIRFINDNFRNKLTIPMIAKHVNLNESYICRVFKSETKQSIFTYIIAVRMKRAAALLLEKNMSIRDVALEVGILDQFYFNRVFKKHFGVNPSNYRKVQKED